MRSMLPVTHGYRFLVSSNPFSFVQHLLGITDITTGKGFEQHRDSGRGMKLGRIGRRNIFIITMKGNYHTQILITYRTFDLAKACTKG
jgi:hypothetical protein